MAYTTLARKMVCNGSKELTFEHHTGSSFHAAQGTPYVLVWQRPAAFGRKANILDMRAYKHEGTARAVYDRSKGGIDRWLSLTRNVKLSIAQRALSVPTRLRSIGSISMTVAHGGCTMVPLL